MAKPMPGAEWRVPSDWWALVLVGLFIVCLGGLIILGVDHLDVVIGPAASVALLTISGTVHALTSVWLRQRAPVLVSAQAIGIINAVLAVCDLAAIITRTLP